jgi:hypothetical protein
MASIALTSITERAAQYAAVQRKNQFSKLCLYSTETHDSMDSALKDPNYLIA